MELKIVVISYNIYDTMSSKISVWFIILCRVLNIRGTKWYRGLLLFVVDMLQICNV